MSAPAKTPLDRARAKLVQIERELKKSPDFQLYLIAKSHSDRARMKHLLMEIPHFRLWRVLANAVKRTRCPAHGALQKQTGDPYEDSPAALEVPVSMLATVARYHRIGDYPDVRFWHKADIVTRLTNVRFWG